MPSAQLNHKVLNKTGQKLLKAIRARKARVGILGLGYVGLPLAMAFVKKGFSVTGIDLDRNRIEKLSQGKSYIEDVPSEEISAGVKRKKFFPTDDTDALAEADVVIICVPTPLNRAKDPDLSFVSKATQSVQKTLHPGELIILESTTYPGTTEEIVLPTLERSGLKVGEDFFLCFSPERIDPGNKRFPLNKIPKIVGGITTSSTKLGAALYGNVTERVMSVSSARTAEMAKLLENTFRIVNIGLVNELAKVADALKIDIWEAIDAASTKPFGYMPFYPGPGIGGHCIGVDPLYLSWKARIQGVDIHFIELARRMNAEMPRFVVDRAVHILNSYAQKAVSVSRILILGLSYKKDVSDTRESPAFEIIHGLQTMGAKLHYHDPYVPSLEHNKQNWRSEPLTAQSLRSKDLVIVTTNHSRVNYDFVAKNARLIFDTRNIRWPAKYAEKIVKL